MATTQLITGKIVGCSPVEQYTRSNGSTGVKCVFHIKADNGQEVAVCATGDLTNWAGCIDYLVDVEYVNRVFPFKRRSGIEVFGNDIYAKSITYHK